MTFHFIGGEDHDFSKLGVASVDTATTSARRTANARCTLKVGPAAGLTDGWVAALDSAVSELWLTVRSYNSDNAGVAGQDLISFMDGTTRRLVLTTDAGGAGTTKIRLIKRNAANANTTLATASVNVSANTLLKLDVYVDYDVAGTVNVYQDGTLILSYSGDVTTDAATTLNGFVLGNYGAGSQYWSEAIVATIDTRGLSCITMAPAANGNTFGWSNSYANVDEVTLDDSDLITAGAADLVAQTTVTTTGLVGNPAVLAVCVSARGQKGSTGPANLQLNVRTGAADYFSANKALPTSPARLSNIWEQNPGTVADWTIADLSAVGFNVGVKSIA